MNGFPADEQGLWESYLFLPVEISFNNDYYI